MIPLSVLDLSPIAEGSDATQSFRNTISLAQHAEQWGYKRYWLAEHHGMPGIASAATSVLIGQVGAATRSIRVGAGGIMLPNHSPLVIAEQFGTLEALFPGRVDLGLGRAPGSDQLTARALRRKLEEDADEFPRDVIELINYFEAEEPGQHIRAVPGTGLRVPVWILGSSLFGAQLAAHLGLPYAFASHFAPQAMMQAVQMYRQMFRPSQFLDKPYAMLGVNVFAADTKEEAELLFTSLQQSFVNLRSGRPSKLPPPQAGYAAQLAPHETAMLQNALSCTVVGTPDEVRKGLEEFAARTGADELMVTAQVYDHAARLRSFQIAAEVCGQVKSA